MCYGLTIPYMIMMIRFMSPFMYRAGWQQHRCCMQRLHTIKLRDGTSVRLDMREQTWCLLPDLLSAPAAKRSADEVTRQNAGHVDCTVICSEHSACSLPSALAKPDSCILRYNHQHVSSAAEVALQSRFMVRGAVLCMQADVASSSMAPEHDACKQPESCKALQQLLPGAIDLTSPQPHCEAELQALLIATTTMLTQMCPTVLHAVTFKFRPLPSQRLACTCRQ